MTGSERGTGIAGAQAGWRRWLWGEPGGYPAVFPLRVLRAILLTTQAFRNNRLNVHASGLSFYLLLSVVPFLAFIFLLLKAFQVPDMLVGPLLRFLVGGNRELAVRLLEYIGNAQGGMVGGVGILVTLFVGFTLLQRVKTTLNLIWEVRRWPGYGSRLIEYLTVLAVTPLLLMATFSASAALSSETVKGILAQWRGLGPLYVFLVEASRYGVLWLITYYAYAFLPDTRVRWWAALAGAVVGGTAMIYAQNLYVQFIFELTRQNLVYGALAVLPALMVWFYLAWLIFLFGAQLSCVVQKYRVFLERFRYGGEGDASLPFLTLMVLAVLQRLYTGSGKPVPLAALSARLNQARVSLLIPLQALKEAELIVPLPEAEEVFLPRERLERVTVREVLERTRLLPGFAEPRLLAERMGASPVLGLFQQANRGLTGPLDGLTVQALAERLTEPARPSGSLTPTPGAAPERVPAD